MTVFDMRDYLLGDGRVYSLIGKYPDGRTTVEVCQTQMVSPNLGWQVKNENGEEIGFTAGYIRRGTDFSMSDSQYYQLWTTTGELGTRWCPRYWRSGEPFLREVEVRAFSKQTGQLVSKYFEATRLEIIIHYETWTSPSGLVVPDVLELTWYTSPNSPKLERYRYAKGVGLVGFENLSGMMFTSFIGSFLSADKAPTRKIYPSVPPMTVPVQSKPAPTLPAKGDKMWKPFTLKTTTGHYMRTNTKLDGEFVGKILNNGKALTNGAKLMVINEAGLIHHDEENEYWWYGVWNPETDEIGWMALRKGAKFEDQFVAITPAPPEGEEPEPAPEEPEPEPPVDPLPTPDPHKEIVVHAALSQLRAMMIRRRFIHEELARLDKEAQGLMTDILTMTNLLESANIDLPDWATTS